MPELKSRILRRPHDPAAPASPPREGRWIALSFLFLFANFFGTACMCGHHSLASLPGHLLPLAALGYLLIHGRDRSIPTRMMIVAVLSLACVATLANLHNVLWSGHDPFF